MKIAIAGRMASGKTTLAKALAEHWDGEILSLGGKVKEVGKDLFGMVEKDRPLLQQIGMKMREIRPDVWIEYLDREASKRTSAVVDDCRFVNEARWFKDNGWLLVRLNIEEEVQKVRLQKTYPDDWEQHWNNRNDPSETQVSEIPSEWIHYELAGEQSVDDLMQILATL
ncbi:AAA family ATPase [bacterium]|nr:AAA family ATPase [bacterium]